jgi:hypothetical protein
MIDCTTLSKEQLENALKCFAIDINKFISNLDDVKKVCARDIIDTEIIRYASNISNNKISLIDIDIEKKLEVQRCFQERDTILSQARARSIDSHEESFAIISNEIFKGQKGEECLSLFKDLIHGNKKYPEEEEAIADVLHIAVPEIIFNLEGKRQSK